MIPRIEPCQPMMDSWRAFEPSTREMPRLRLNLAQACRQLDRRRLQFQYEA